MEKKIKKILILRMEHIGDYALSLPAIAGIRKKYPKAEIDIVVGHWNKSLAEATPYVDNVIVFENPLVKRNIGKFRVIWELFFKRKYAKLLGEINRKGYDLLVDFSDRNFMKFILEKMEVKKKVSGLNLETKDNEKEVDRCLRVVSELEVARPEKVGLRISKKNKKEVDEFIKDLRDFFVIHPLTPLEEKNWPMEKWKGLLKRIGENLIIIGGKNDKGKNSILEEENILNASGKFTLLQTTYLISKAKKFIGLDSGPMHLAELTSTPIVAIFGPTDEKRWGPYRETDKVIKKEDIKDISVEEVLETI